MDGLYTYNHNWRVGVLNSLDLCPPSMLMYSGWSHVSLVQFFNWPMRLRELVREACCGGKEYSLFEEKLI